MAKRKENKGWTPRLILIGGIFAVVSMVVGIVCVLGAVFTYGGSLYRPLPLSWLPYSIPIINTGYSLQIQYISELGIGSSAFLFNMGLIITGIIAIPIFPGLLGLFKDSIIAKIGIALGVVGSVALVGIGLCPMVMSSLHGFFAMVFFISVGIAIILLSVKMYQGTFFHKAIPIYGVFFAAVDLSFLVLHSALTEWAVFFVIVTWILAVGVWVLIKRKEIEA